MITMIPGGHVNEYRGLSTDTKPLVNVPNGSTFYELDKAKLYLFDENSGQWIEWK